MALLLEYNIDVAIFSEYRETFNEEKVNAIGDYIVDFGLGGNDKIVVLYESGMRLRVSREGSRYTLYTIYTKDKIFNLVGVHLQDHISGCDEDRLITLSELANDVRELEKENKSSKTLVIGDFNASPFDKEMINKKALNAVLFRSIIEKNEVTTFEKKKYKRFYNPMLLYLSEENHVYGSHYYSSGSNTLNWYTYDQFVVRKELIEKIKSYNYCKYAGSINLMTRNDLPDKNYSDHLPLFVEVEL